MLLLAISPVLAQKAPKEIKVSDNIKLIKLSDNVYQHISYLQIEGYGKIGANGLILVKNGKALMVDTPWNNSQTEELYSWLINSLHVTVKNVIPTHWHEDSMGGLEYLHSQSVNSYASQKTIDIAEEKNLPAPESGFINTISIHFEGIPVECYYMGGGHSTDNIVVWLPTEEILFGGDVVKDIKSKSLGSLTDADLEAWPTTLQRISEKFPKASIVVPGHGNIGGTELIQHTLQLLGK